jgi:hypothetical protein
MESARCTHIVVGYSSGACMQCWLAQCRTSFASMQCCLLHPCHHHHHVTQSSHSINALHPCELRQSQSLETDSMGCMCCEVQVLGCGMQILLSCQQPIRLLAFALFAAVGKATLGQAHVSSRHRQRRMLCVP